MSERLHPNIQIHVINAKFQFRSTKPPCLVYSGVALSCPGKRLEFRLRIPLSKSLCVSISLVVQVEIRHPICNQLNSDNFQILVNLSDILKDSGELGTMQLEIFHFEIKSLDTYEKDLIKVTKI